MKIKYLYLLLMILPINLYGVTIIVDQNGDGDYTSIQSGVNGANSGDTILVRSGTYIEAIYINTTPLRNVKVDR